MSDSTVPVLYPCKQCGVEKPRTKHYFFPHKYGDGLKITCRDCQNRRARELSRDRGARPRPTLSESFWSKIDKQGPLMRPELGPCWGWTGNTNPCGYGQLYRISGKRKRSIGAHRISWELHNGPIPGGLHVLHRCDNPPCCNPAHLFLGTPADNMADKVAKGRQHRGERTGGAYLTEEIVRDMRRRYEVGETIGNIARRYRLSPGHTSRVVQRIQRRHVS